MAAPRADGSGKIAFVMGSGVYTVNEDGSELVQVVKGSGFLRTRTPDWSADGRSLVLSGAVGLFTERLDGEVRILTRDRSDIEPSWSPDGRRIVFAREDPATRGQGLFIVSADGSGVTMFAPPGGPFSSREPSWSPDGGRIAFEGDGDIWISNADGSGVAQRLTGGSSPAWSPDGRYIAYSLRGAIFVMRPDGSGSRGVITRQYAYSPTWSPDGKKIAYAGRVSPERQEYLEVVNADGSGLLRINTPYAVFYPDWSPASVGQKGSCTREGTAGDDNIEGGLGNDVLCGRKGDDELRGGRGDDRLYGGPGRDALRGAAGNDFLRGDSGVDNYSGGAGNDRVDSADGKKEQVRCGEGDDKVKADRLDRLIDCETETRTKKPRKRARRR